MSRRDLSVALLTREYPPDVYGGAGVHVEYLAKELDRLVDVTVHCWGAPRPGATPRVVAYEPWAELAGSEPYMAALRTMSIDLAMAAGIERRRPRPQPHVVREPRRAPRRPRSRDPARRDRAQPRAAAAVEGGAARRRLRGLVVLRALGARGRGRDHRRLGGHAPRPDRLLPGGRPGPRDRDPQRDRYRRVHARPRHGGARPPRRRPRPARRRCSSAA